MQLLSNGCLGLTYPIFLARPGLGGDLFFVASFIALSIPPSRPPHSPRDPSRATWAVLAQDFLKPTSMRRIGEQGKRI